MTTPDESLERRLERYSRTSSSQPIDPFTEVDWSPLSDCLPGDDERWCLPADAAFERCDRWQQMDDRARGRFAFDYACHMAMAAIAFERTLQEGLLIHLRSLPVGSPEYRYVHHEIIEESRHSQMFGALLNRCDAESTPIPEVDAWLNAIDLRRAGASEPEVLFLAALSIEQPLDVLNRQTLRLPTGTGHPVIEQISRIHVREEARHIGYATNYLRSTVPTLSSKARRRLEILAPMLVLEAAWLMCVPSSTVLQRHGMSLDSEGGDRTVLTEYARELSSGVRRLCEQIGLIGERSTRVWDTWIPGRGRAAAGVPGEG